MLLLLLSLAAHAGIFVSADQADQLAQAGAVVVDARGLGDWKKGHVPGSAPLSWLSLRDGLLRVGRLTDDTGKLQAAIRAAGVRGGAPVVVYDAGRDGWGEAGRIWWMLDYLGHSGVHILDGGWPAWQAAGLDQSTDSQLPPPGDFVPRPNEQRRARLSEVEQAVAKCMAGSCDTVFWDTREQREYDGATPYGERRGGHIPGAVHVWFADLTDPRGMLLPQDQLRAVLNAAGITPDHPIITYCTGGVRSGFAVAVLRSLNYPQAANYDGSMWEWSSDKGHPLE